MNGDLTMPTCCARQEFNREEGLYFCGNPDVHVANDLVTRAVCQSCSRWTNPPKKLRPFPTKLALGREGACLFLGPQTALKQCPSCKGNVQLKVFDCGHPAHESTTLPDCAICQDYERQLMAGTIRNWAVGVTTAPRAQPTLEQCLASLQRAGWTNCRIFAEPGSAIPTEIDATVTWRASTLGAWPNFLLGLNELYLSNPRADAYFMLQDDVVFCGNIREFLENQLWPTRKLGLVSIYTPSPYATDEPGFHEVEIGQCLLGALTYIFPNALVRLLLASSDIVEHRLRPEPTGLREIDAVIGRWARRLELPVYYHSPSLAQHIGKHSTIWAPGDESASRTAQDFVGESFDALDLLKAIG